MLSLPAPEQYGEPSRDQHRQHELTIEAISTYLVSLARRLPLVVVFEDAHWADPSSIALLDVLVDAVSSARVLLVISHRPELLPRWSGRHHVTSIHLNRLSRKESMQLAVLFAGEKLSDDLLKQIMEKTDGVPLFVEELTKSVVESAPNLSLPQGSDAPIAIPQTLHDSLLARLDRLPLAKSLAQYASDRP